MSHRSHGRLTVNRMISKHIAHASLSKNISKNLANQDSHFPLPIGESYRGFTVLDLKMFCFNCVLDLLENFGNFIKEAMFDELNNLKVPIVSFKNCPLPHDLEP